MRLPRRALALLLPALVAVAAGCGGDADAKNAYVDAVQTAQRDYVTTFDQVRQRLTPTSTLAQDRKTLGAFGTATRRFVAKLQATEPPASIKKQHDGLIAAVRDYERQVERAQRQLGTGSNADRARVRTDLSSSVQATQAKIARAILRINDALRD